MGRKIKGKWKSGGRKGTKGKGGSHVILFILYFVCGEWLFRGRPQMEGKKTNAWKGKEICWGCEGMEWQKVSERTLLTVRAKKELEDRERRTEDFWGKKDELLWENADWAELWPPKWISPIRGEKVPFRKKWCSEWMKWHTNFAH
jgi:hypothetical protein